jgi:two-component system OmpR family sensor kinase
MSIKARLLVTISLLIFIALVVIGIVTLTITGNQMIRRVDESLVAASGPPSRFDGFGENGRFERFGKRAIATLIYDLSGVVQVVEPSGFGNDPDPLPNVEPDQLASRANEVFTVDAVGDSRLRYRVLITPLDEGLFLVSAAPLDEVDTTLRNLRFVIAVTGLAVLAFAIVAVWLIVQRGLHPIDAMIGTAGQIAEGDLSRRVGYEDQSSEVGQLGRALNVMLGRIETSFAAKEASERRLRQFVADASHELRTPLTSIRGYAELYRSGAAQTPDEIERVMARIESEGTRMGTLVEDLLLLARLDQGRPLRREPVDLAALLADAVADAQVANPDHPITLTTAGAVTIVGDADRLRQVADNLLTNACVHTGPGTLVTVSVEETGDEALIIVADDGPGMSLEDAAHAFDRFYRADQSRTRVSGGAGLGLSIVAAIVDAHGGSVTLDAPPGQGTSVTIRLPRNLPPE